MQVDDADAGSPPGRPLLACWGPGATIASRDLPPRATARGRAREGRAGGSFGGVGDDERDAVISRGRTGTARPRIRCGGRPREARMCPCRFAESSMLSAPVHCCLLWLFAASASISAGDRAIISWRDDLRLLLLLLTSDRSRSCMSLSTVRLELPTHLFEVMSAH
jgi:hypothetical protein